MWGPRGSFRPLGKSPANSFSSRPAIIKTWEIKLSCALPVIGAVKLVGKKWVNKLMRRHKLSSASWDHLPQPPNPLHLMVPRFTERHSCCVKSKLRSTGINVYGSSRVTVVVNNNRYRYLNTSLGRFYTLKDHLMTEFLRSRRLGPGSNFFWWSPVCPSIRSLLHMDSDMQSPRS